MKFIYALALIAFSLRLAAQTNVPVLSNTPTLSSEKLLYAHKVEKFKRLKTTGFLMAGAGTILAIVGISNLASVDYTSSSYSSSSSSSSGPNDPKYVSGLLMLEGGIGLMGGGIPLAIIGSKQSKRWQRKLDGLTVNLKLSPNQQGLALAYKF